MTSSELTIASPSPPFRPCIQGIGTKPNNLMILGEAPGAEEEKLGIPVVGSSGQELNRMLQEAGINPGSPYKTNVFWTRPKDNRLSTLMLSQQQWKELGKPEVPQMKVEGKLMYLHPSLTPELERLEREIEECNPNLILTLGNTALWSLSGRQNISSMRGTTLISSKLSRPRKILPTYHPAAVLRQWDLRSIVIADLMKAKIQSRFPEVRRPQRLITVNPSLSDLEAFFSSLDENPGGAAGLAVDIETRLGQITEIGFAPSPTKALVVPFIKGFKTHYWTSPSDEVQALRLCKAILQHPIPKIFQNGLYDLQYIWRTWRFAPKNCLHDTMLKHHSLFPELQKGLGFLGSLYTDEPAWKMMRNKKDTQEKRDDE
jgi:uracil-DNA glycosylase